MFAFSIVWVEIEMVPSISEGASCSTTYRACAQGLSQVADLRVEQTGRVLSCRVFSFRGKDVVRQNLGLKSCHAFIEILRQNKLCSLLSARTIRKRTIRRPLFYLVFYL